MGAELFHVDRRKHTTNLIVVFRNFVNAPALQKQKIIRREFYNISVNGLNHVQKHMLRICEACIDGEARYFDNLLWNKGSRKAAKKMNLNFPLDLGSVCDKVPMTMPFWGTKLKIIYVLLLFLLLLPLLLLLLQPLRLLWIHIIRQKTLQCPRRTRALTVWNEFPPGSLTFLRPILVTYRKTLIKLSLRWVTTSCAACDRLHLQSGEILKL